MTADKKLRNRGGETGSPKDRIERPICLITTIELSRWGGRRIRAV
jgi:hypothetical protein